MKLKLVFALALMFGGLTIGALSAQDLPQNIRKISDGIFARLWKVIGSYRRKSSTGRRPPSTWASEASS